jgi:hypothetical protein
MLTSLIPFKESQDGFNLFIEKILELNIINDNEKTYIWLTFLKNTILNEIDNNFVNL